VNECTHTSADACGISAEHRWRLAASRIVHLLAGLKPTHCVADVLCAIKKASSKWAHDLGLQTFRWQDGYSAFTVGQNGVEKVRQYIANQAEHHQKTTFEEEYREFLNANGIKYDERYLL
jgi:hypothetical protein